MTTHGVVSAIELYPAFEAGLHRVEKHSHFWIMAWLGQRQERDVLQVIPRGGDTLHGVFAVRSPARPNPIGLTAARLLRRQGLTLYFDQLDFADATEILDIKPYFATRDLIFVAANRPVGRPRSREALQESLRFQVVRFVPDAHPEVDRALAILEHFRIELCGWVEPDAYELQAPLGRPYLADALIGLTRVSLTRGLTLTNADEVVLNGHRYACSEDQLYLGRR